MKISIIIPVHNLENEITQCLDSIAVQDFDRAEFEVLLVLDSCTDQSESVIRAWHSGHGDIDLHIFFTESRSPGGARNVGLDVASGDYILFIDGDDYLINTSAMSLLYDAVQGHNAVRVMDHERSGTHVKFTNRLTLWLHFFSRELIGTERFTNMLLNEDFEFVKRIRSKPEYNEAKLYVPLYFYNYNEARMVQRILDVCRATGERKQQGLPPLYVDDEFVAEGNANAQGINRAREESLGNR